MGKIIKDTAVLLVITLVAGFLLGLVYDITLEPIAHQEELANAKACQEVFFRCDGFYGCTDRSGYAQSESERKRS